MKTWMRLGIGIAALAFAIAIGTAAYAMRDDEGPTQPQPAIVAEDALGDGDATNQQDTSLTMICVAGTVDCNDTPGMEYGDFGEEEAAKCAADGPGCFEPTGCPPEGCTTSYEECVTLETDPPITRCTGFGCGSAVPVPEILVDPVPDPAVDPGFAGPEDQVEPAPAEVPAIEPSILVAPAPDQAPIEPIIVGEGCLGEDPCTISSTPVEGCLPPHCAVSSDGAIACPSYPACDLPVQIDPAQGTAEGFPEVEARRAEQACSGTSCVDSDPAVGAPEGVVEECSSPPSEGDPGVSGGGTSGSGGSTEGPIETQPGAAE